MLCNTPRIGRILCIVISSMQATLAAEPAQPKGANVALVYSKQYEINLGGLERLHPFDIHKYTKICRQLIKDRLVRREDFHVPKPVDREQILLVHTEKYLERLKDPKRVAEYLEAPMVGALPAAMLDRGMLSAFRHASGGTLLAARLALKHGVAINLGGGYHHAKPDNGEGFCIYADMPIAIRVLRKEKLIRRALVIDLDVHQGNGTAVCCQGDESVFTFSMHQGDIYPIPKEKSDRDIELPAGTDDRQYMKILRKALPELIDRARPDLVLLQAGCDVLAGDPLASLKITKQGIVTRDSFVVDTCVERAIPIVVTLGGGYSPEAWSVQHASIRQILATHGVLRRDSP